MLYDPEKEPREKWGRTPREMGESPARNGGKPREKWGKGKTREALPRKG